MRTLIVDSEFTSFSATAKLLSIAVVDPVTGEHFYAEITDTVFAEIGPVSGKLSGKNLSDLDGPFDQFVIENILPQFDYAKHGMPMEMAAKKLAEFLEGFGVPLRLASDAVAWDYNMLCQLFDGELPKSIKPLMSQMKNISDESDALWFGSVDDPFPHHALKDAQILSDACRQQFLEY